MTHDDVPKHRAVLLLEDQPVLAISLCDYIEEAGGEVVEVRTADEAIRVLEQRSDIRVVMADLDVHGSVAGLKLALLIRSRWPPIELILTSSAPRAPLASELPERGAYFGKPFDVPRLISTVRRFLELA